MCRAFPALADKSSVLFKGTGGTGKYRLQSLKSHHNSSSHNNCSKRWDIENKNAKQPLPMMIKAMLAKLDQQTQSRMEIMFNTAFYVASEGLAFKKFPGLLDLQEKNGLDIGIQYRNDKKCKEFVSSIASVERQRISEEVHNARFLCVLADGSTDKSITEQEAVYVRYTGPNGRPSTQFADIVALESADAVGVTKGIQKGLEAVDIDNELLKEKLAGCNFDGASVMMGKRGGVTQQLQAKIGRPVIVIHCVAHRLELAVLDAVKTCSYLNRFEDTIKSIFKFYFYSPKRRREVNEIANILEEDVVYYSGVQNTRWLASRHRAICALEKHFPTTVMHLQHKAGTSDEQGQQAKGILKDLQSEKFVKYLYFMMDVTKVLSTLSKTFQSDELCITDVVTSLETTLTILEQLRQEKGPQYKRFEEGYCEETGILKCGKNNTQEVRLTRAGTSLEREFDSFLTEVKGYIDNRFGNLQEEPLSFFKVFDPREMPQERSHLATYGNLEVKSLVEHFSNYLTEEEERNITAQWPALRTRLVRQKAISPNDVFSNLLASRPDDVKDCLVLLDLMLTLSPSTAKCERGFSAMNHLKCNLRTTLGQNTLSDLMRMRSSDQTIKAYKPNAAINNWFSAAKTKRHIL